MHEAPEQAAVPDQKPDAADGLMCFLNADRVCGVDCMAYTTAPEQSPLSVQQRHCVLIVGVERLARHVAVGAKLLNDMQVAAKDRQRTEQRPPPPPR